MYTTTNTKIRRGSEVAASRIHRRQKSLIRDKISGTSKPNYQKRIKVKARHNQLTTKGNNNGPPNRSHNRPVHHRTDPRRVIRMFKKHITNDSRIGTAELSINTKRDRIRLSEQIEFNPQEPEEFFSSDSSLTEIELSNRLCRFVREMIMVGMT